MHPVNLDPSKYKSASESINHYSPATKFLTKLTYFLMQLT